MKSLVNEVKYAIRGFFGPLWIVCGAIIAVSRSKKMTPIFCSVLDVAVLISAINLVLVIFGVWYDNPLSAFACKYVTPFVLVFYGIGAVCAGIARWRRG